MSDDDLKRRALQLCAVELANKMTPDALVPHLDKCNMLTENEKYTLCEDLTKSRPQKVNYLIARLPTKGSEWWKNFIESLRKTIAGTAHEELANRLEEELVTLKGGHVGRYSASLTLWTFMW